MLKNHVVIESAIFSASCKVSYRILSQLSRLGWPVRLPHFKNTAFAALPHRAYSGAAKVPGAVYAPKPVAK